MTNSCLFLKFSLRHHNSEKDFQACFGPEVASEIWKWPQKCKLAKRKFRKPAARTNENGPFIFIRSRLPGRFLVRKLRLNPRKFRFARSPMNVIHYINLGGRTSGFNTIEFWVFKAQFPTNLLVFVFPLFVIHISIFLVYRYCYLYELCL